MANVKKDCQSAKCPEAIVDDVPCGPRDCMPMGPCPTAEKAAEEVVEEKK